MYVAGSHSAPYASRNSAFAGMTSSASVTPNASACAAQQRDDEAWARAAHGPAVVLRAALRRDTSAAITPCVSSGQSASRASSTALSMRRASVSSIAVTDAERGSGSSAASSPTVTPGPSSTSVLTSVMDAHEPFDDREEVFLDRALLDEHRSG